jgi:hypothetical protein
VALTQAKPELLRVALQVIIDIRYLKGMLHKIELFQTVDMAPSSSDCYTLKGLSLEIEYERSLGEEFIEHCLGASRKMDQKCLPF